MENAWKWEIKVESILSKLLSLAIEYFCWAKCGQNNFSGLSQSSTRLLPVNTFIAYFMETWWMVWKILGTLKINIKMITGAMMIITSILIFQVSHERRVRGQRSGGWGQPLAVTRQRPVSLYPRRLQSGGRWARGQRGQGTGEAGHEAGRAQRLWLWCCVTWPRDLRLRGPGARSDLRTGTEGHGLQLLSLYLLLILGAQQEYVLQPQLLTQRPGRGRGWPGLLGGEGRG